MSDCPKTRFNLEESMKLLNSLHKLRKWYKVIYKHQDKVDIGRELDVPFPVKLKYNLLGFTVQDYYAFQLGKNDYRQYISFWERWRLENINGRFAYFLGEKLVFERFFGQTVRVPHIFAWINRGKAIDFNTGEEVDLVSVIKDQGVLIAKPTRSIGGGNGVKRFEFKDGALYANGELLQEEWLRSNLRKFEDYIFVELIHQADYAASVFPGSTNSMRIATGRHKDGSVEVLFAFHRFGCAESAPVDNLSSGGISAYIDEDGVLTSGKRLTNIENWYSTHPDTGAQIEGLRVPGWKEITEALVKAHKSFPYYTFFAWDAVIGQDGVPCILEINRGSDLSIQSIHPLRNEKLGAFMREYGLLDKKLDP